VKYSRILPFLGHPARVTLAGWDLHRGSALLKRHGQLVDSGAAAGTATAFVVVANPLAAKSFPGRVMCENKVSN